MSDATTLEKALADLLHRKEEINTRRRELHDAMHKFEPEGVNLPTDDARWDALEISLAEADYHLFVWTDDVQELLKSLDPSSIRPRTE